MKQKVALKENIDDKAIRHEGTKAGVNVISLDLKLQVCKKTSRLTREGQENIVSSPSPFEERPSSRGPKAEPCPFNARGSIIIFPSPLGEDRTLCEFTSIKEFLVRVYYFVSSIYRNIFAGEVIKQKKVGVRYCPVREGGWHGLHKY